MRARLLAFELLVLCAGSASAAVLGPKEAPAELGAQPLAPLNRSAALPQYEPKLSLSPLTPSVLPVCEVQTQPDPPANAARQEPDPEQKIQRAFAAATETAAQPEAPADEAGSAEAGRRFERLTGKRLAADEPSDEDVQAARRAVILRNPTVPPSVSNVIERETGLTSDHPLFTHISRHGSQPRNSHTNAPLGEAYSPVNPKQVIVGLFNLRQDKPAYYRSLRNEKTGVTATGVRGGVDTMIEDLLGKGFIQPRSAGRNHAFLNGVYMDLPNYIHEARKWASVDPYKAEGKDRYPMVVAFRAGNVHNPGSEHQGRIVGDGGTLGQVALDKVTPADIVSIYVQRSRIAQTLARLKGTALAHVQVLPIDILPNH